MKIGIRIVITAAAVLAMAIGAWSVVAAQRNGVSAGFVPNVRDLASSLFRQDQQETEVEHSAEALQPADDHSALHQEVEHGSAAVEDNSKQPADDHTAEAAGTPEPGDDNGGHNQPAEAPEAHGELTGAVTAINATSITIDGRVFQLATDAEGAANIQPGAVVKVEFVTNADGTLSVREIKVGEASGNSADSNRLGDDSSVHHESRSASGSGSDGEHHGGGSGGGGDDGSGG